MKKITSYSQKILSFSLTIILITGGMSFAFPQISPVSVNEAFALGTNGKIAFYSFRDGNSEIYTMNSDGTGQTRLTNNAAVDNTPSLSPDGTKIAFESDRDGNHEIYTMNSDGTGVTRLTNIAAVDQQPDWSPDGTKIVFASFRDGNHEIYTMNSDGTGVTRLTNIAASDNAPDWSPDGTKIVFQSDRDGNLEIYTMNSDGTGVTRLTNNFAIDAHVNWSPDGTKIAFFSDRAGNYEIYTMNSDGTGQTNISNNAAKDGNPNWSPDGTKIAFFSDRAGNGDIYVMNSDGTGQTNISNNAALDGKPSWGSAITSPITVTITSPSEGAVLSSGSIIVTGTASDPDGIQKVEVSVDGDAFSLATGTTSWSFTTGVLSSGSHTIVAKATSNAGIVGITTVPVGTTPQAVAVNPTTNTIYVASYGTSTVSVINGLTNTVSATIPVGFNPQQIAINPTTNTMYVVSFEGSSIHVVNMATNTVTTTIPLSSNGLGVAVNPTTNTVYASRYFNNDVVVINGATNTITSTISGISSPSKIAVNPTTNTVYVSNQNSASVTVINGATNTVTSIVPLPVGTHPAFTAVNPTTNTIYVPNGNPAGSISVINGATNTITDIIITVGTYSYGIAVNPTTNTVYVSDIASNSVSVINGATNTITSTIPVGSNPREVAVNPTTNTIYVVNLGSSTVSVINGATIIPETVSTSVSFTITAPDTMPPVITLLGNNPASTECGSSYNDAGATAQDDPDGDITSNIVVGGLPIDTSVPGSGSVTYDVSDAAGNAAATATRTVNVVDTTAPTVTTTLVPFGSDDGKFIVSIGATDSCDPLPAVTANLNGVPVTDGQPVKLEVGDETESKLKSFTAKQCTKFQEQADKKTAKGKPIPDSLQFNLLVCEAGSVLQMEDSSFTLTVTATDASGNSGIATSSPTFAADEDDE